MAGHRNLNSWGTVYNVLAVWRGGGMSQLRTSAMLKVVQTTKDKTECGNHRDIPLVEHDVKYSSRSSRAVTATNAQEESSRRRNSGTLDHGARRSICSRHDACRTRPRRTTAFTCAPSTSPMRVGLRRHKPLVKCSSPLRRANENTREHSPTPRRYKIMFVAG